MNRRLLFFILVMIAIAMPAKLWAQEAYVVLSGDGKGSTLTFYYDDQKENREGWMPMGQDGTNITWTNYAQGITKVIFDESFANCTTLTSTASWFSGFNNLVNIEGIEYLKTDNVADMSNMFNHCSSLTSIDVSGFKTDNVTDMSAMFYNCIGLTSLDVSGFKTDNMTYTSVMFWGCAKLTTIYVASEWSTAKVEYGDAMFTGCTKLVGGAGTVYDADHVDYSYAHIDEGPEKPGYFTDKNAPVVLDTVMAPTFVYESYDRVMIETETEGAEIFYRMNGRMLQENDMDFGNGLYNTKWKIIGDNKSYGDATNGGYRNYGLKLISKKDSVYESAQAVYRFDKALTKGDYYTIHFMGRSESGNGKLEFYCENDTLNGTRSAADTLTIGKDWTNYEVTVKIENDKTNRFALNFGGVADTYYIDNVLFGPVISDTTNNLFTHYVAPIELHEGITITAVAVKEGMEASVPKVFDDFYDGWEMLMKTEYYGWDVCESAEGDPNVPLQQVLATADMIKMVSHELMHRRESQDVDDTELIANVYKMYDMLYEIEMMKRGFTIDGVSYHAVDSTQVEVVASLNYGNYQGVVTIADKVNFNDITFNVTSVAKDAFKDSELGAIIWNADFTMPDSVGLMANNANLLVYVNNDAQAPANINNVVVNGHAKKIVLADVTEGSGNFLVPQAFTAENISYERVFNQETMVGVSRGWEGIALPFDVQSITHEKSGTISPFGRNDDNKHFWLRRLGSSGLVQADKMEAYVPYIIAMPNSSEYPEAYNLAGRVTFSATNASVPVTEVRTLALSDSTILMASTMQRMSRSSRYYALNVGEVRGQYLEGSVFERDYRVIRPFEVYTMHSNNTPAPRFVPIKDMTNGDVTGIEDVRDMMSDGRGENWYDLNGRKLQQKPTRKGVYLNNGQKVIIR